MARREYYGIKGNLVNTLIIVNISSSCGLLRNQGTEQVCDVNVNNSISPKHVKIKANMPLMKGR